jgi:STE24 endopeptidase
MSRCRRTVHWPAFALLLALATAAAAQTPEQSAGSPSAAPAADSSSTARETTSQPTLEVPPTAALPAAAFDVEAATRAYLEQLSPAEKERSDRYFEGGYWLLLWGFLYGLAVAWLLLARRISARMRDLAERVTRFRFLQAALYAVQYVLVTTVLFFPFTVYQGFLREHQYDLSTQTFGAWMRDQAVGLGVSVVLLGLGLAVLYAVLRKVGRSWWIWGAGLTVVFLAFVMLIAPVFIDPLFNTYEPLHDAKIKEEILEIARANEVPAREVYQFDASRQSTRISANVSGFLGTMRIRLNDNLLNRCSPPEIEAVMGHELGHYVLNHIYEMLVEFGVLVVVGFAFLARAFPWVLRRWGSGWGVRGVDDPAGWPLLVALLSIFFFVLTPVTNSIIRSNEREADLFSLNAARQPDGFAAVSMKLSEYRKIEPGPLEEALLYDHPSGYSRVQMAMTWKNEHLEEARERETDAF